MTNCEINLKELLEDTVMPDIEDAIDDIFEEIASNKAASKNQEDELEQMQELRVEFTQILSDINEGKLEDDECSELLEEIEEMIKEAEEE